jgi:hypothetical protein
MRILDLRSFESRLSKDWAKPRLQEVFFGVELFSVPIVFDVRRQGE